MAFFRLNPNLVAELERDAAVDAEMRRKADKIAETAQSIAPVGTDLDPHPGEFRDGIHAEGTQVVAGAPNSVYVIFGTSHSPPHDTLRRAAEIEGAHVMKER